MKAGQLWELDQSGQLVCRMNGMVLAPQGGRLAPATQLVIQNPDPRYPQRWYARPLFSLSFSLSHRRRRIWAPEGWLALQANASLVLMGQRPEQGGLVVLGTRP